MTPHTTWCLILTKSFRTLKHYSLSMCVGNSTPPKIFAVFVHFLFIHGLAEHSSLFTTSSVKTYILVVIFTLEKKTINLPTVHLHDRWIHQTKIMSEEVKADSATSQVYRQEFQPDSYVSRYYSGHLEAGVEFILQNHNKFFTLCK